MRIGIDFNSFAKYLLLNIYKKALHSTISSNNKTLHLFEINISFNKTQLIVSFLYKFYDKRSKFQYFHIIFIYFL